VFKLGLVDGPECDGCNRHLKEPRTFCDCDTLTVLRFMHMGHYFLKSSDFADISVSKILQDIAVTIPIFVITSAFCG
jgi:hypothetical protein